MFACTVLCPLMKVSQASFPLCLCVSIWLCRTVSAELIIKLWLKCFVVRAAQQTRMMNVIRTEANINTNKTLSASLSCLYILHTHACKVTSTHTRMCRKKTTHPLPLLSVSCCTSHSLFLSRFLWKWILTWLMSESAPHQGQRERHLQSEWRDGLCI